MKVEDILNRDELFARVDDDLELLGELIEIFLEDYPDLLAEIEAAVIAKDAAKLRHAAHTLKGSVGNFCTTGAFEASNKMEISGANEDFSTVQGDYQTLLKEMENVKNALQLLSQECV